MNDRSNALFNGALVLAGAAAALDTIVVHWVLGWHRLIEGMADPGLFVLELGVVLAGLVLFAVGVWREWRARSTNESRPP